MSISDEFAKQAYRIVDGPKEGEPRYDYELRPMPKREAMRQRRIEVAELKAEIWEKQRELDELISKPQHQKRCFHFSNLQPLFKEENWSKSDTTCGQLHLI